MRRRCAVVVAFAFRRRRAAPTLKPFFLLVVAGFVGLSLPFLFAADAAGKTAAQCLKVRKPGKRHRQPSRAIAYGYGGVLPMFLCQRPT